MEIFRGIRAIFTKKPDSKSLEFRRYLQHQQQLGHSIDDLTKEAPKPLTAKEARRAGVQSQLKAPTLGECNARLKKN